MATIEEMEVAMRLHYEALKEEGTALERLRAYALEKGMEGLIAMAAVIYTATEEATRAITPEEFGEVMYASGLVDGMDLEVLAEIYLEIAAIAGHELITYQDFLIALRPPVSEIRLALIEEVFAHLDAAGAGRISVEDLQAVFVASWHPKFISGEWTEEEVWVWFLTQLPAYGGYITKEDFYTYLYVLSASIEDDAVFLELVRQMWGM